MGRKRKPWFPLMAAGLVMGLFLSGCKKSESLLHPPANEQQIKSFFRAKEAQARQLVSEKNYPFFTSLAQASFRVIVRLKTGFSGRLSSSNVK